MTDLHFSVFAWLESIGFGQYSNLFRENDIDGELLVDLTAADLKDLGIASLGHRKRILSAIHALTAEMDGQTAEKKPLATTLAPELFTPDYLAERILQSRSGLEGEIKQVTILFVDITDSTQLVAALGPEEASRRLYPVLKIMMTAVHRYEGTVNKLQGDGLMAMFGAPLAHEDHAVRACYAALAMRQSIVDETDVEQQKPLKIRIGLHSGEVVVRAINNDLSINYDAIGITAHLAARMEQLADPNSIRMTAETARLAEGFIKYKSVGLLPVKGIAEKIEVFDLQGVTPVRTRWQTTLARGLSSFVGRESEMDLLQRALQRAGQGQGQLVAMVGEAGIGKSRLTYEFSRLAEARGWQVFAASSVSYGQATTWLPVIDLLKNYFGIEESDDRADIMAKVQDSLAELDESLVDEAAALLALFDIHSDKAGWQNLGTVQRRRLSLNALQALLIRESQRKRLLLIFEDLHWIDSETQTLLDELVERLPGKEMLLLVNYRPQYSNKWTHKSTYWQLRLDPLFENQIELLLDDLMGTDPSLDGLKATLLDRADGNPLFIEESVRSLVESGALSGASGAYHLEQTEATVDLPDTIQAIIAQRIDRLQPVDKQLLQTASVIGTHVPLSLLQMVSEQDNESLERGLDNLQSTEFLYETQLFPEIEYTFKHAHTHLVAYQGLLQEQRKILHARIGAAMQDLYAERRWAMSEKLAEHFEKGEVWDQAVAAYLAAARKAKEKYTYDSAHDYAQKAVALAAMSDADQDKEKTEALALLGDMASLRDDLDTANAYYKQAMQIAPDEAHKKQIANRVHRQHHIVRDGAKIVYYSHGHGERVLMLVSPLGYNLSTIQPVVESLSQEFRIISYDNRGIGGSDPILQEYPFSSQVEDVRAVIEALDCGPIALLGLSQGAALVARLAWKYPHLVSKIVLTGMYVGLPKIAVPESEEDLRYWKAIERGDFSLHEEYIWKFVRDRIPEPESRDLVASTRQSFLMIPHNVWRNFASADPDKDPTPILAGIECPALFMNGSLDLVYENATREEYNRAILERMPQAQFYIFENKGHLPLITAQQEFVAVLRRFIRTGQVDG